MSYQDYRLYYNLAGEAVLWYVTADSFEVEYTYDKLQAVSLANVLEQLEDLGLEPTSNQVVARVECGQIFADRMGFESPGEALVIKLQRVF